MGFVADAFRVNAFQFLLKPISRQDFDKDLRRAFEHYKVRRCIYVISHTDGKAAIEVGDIVFIESYGRRLNLHTPESKYTFSGKLSFEESRLNVHGVFILCHKGFLVNMGYIKDVRKKTILLKNDKEIPLSKHRRPDVLKKFNDYLAGSGV